MNVPHESAPLRGFLSVELLSDTTFGRGEGTAGDVDVEVDHDDTGLPRVNGKELHGLLRDAWLSMSSRFPESCNAAALHVLGEGADLRDLAILRIGDAELPADVREWIRYATGRQTHPVDAGDILRSLTEVRRQTSQSRETGAPDTTTLRSVRVVSAGIALQAGLSWKRPPTTLETAVLAASALAVREGGLGRNRGKGALRLSLGGDVKATTLAAQHLRQ